MNVVISFVLHSYCNGADYYTLQYFMYILICSVASFVYIIMYAADPAATFTDFSATEFCRISNFHTFTTFQFSLPSAGDLPLKFQTFQCGSGPRTFQNFLNLPFAQ